MDGSNLQRPKYELLIFTNFNFSHLIEINKHYLVIFVLKIAFFMKTLETVREILITDMTKGSLDH